MVTYSFWAIWNNPPVGLNILETEASEISKAAFHLLWATWQDYPENDIFVGPILVKYGLWCSVMVATALHCKSFSCCSSGKGPPPTHHLLPHPARGCYFHRGRSLTLRIIAHSCVERLREKQKPHIAFKRQIQSKGTWIVTKFTLEII